jgi:glycosyltransferase involved in cell wall biosynthesis
MSASKLRIGLATPWNENSAIARVNLDVARALQDLGVDLTVVRVEAGEPLALPALSREFRLVRACDASLPEIAANVDAMCYAIGDHYPYHGQALRMMATLPGIVLLHDLYLRHLAVGWGHYAGEPNMWAALDAELGYPQMPPEPTLEWLAENAPMVEWPTTMATGAVVHARHYLDRVAAVCPGPIALLPLPGRDIGVAPPRRRRAGSRVRLLTVGRVNINKLPDEVIRAIASSPRLRGVASYRLAGPVQPEMRARLEGLAAELSVDLTMTGALSEADLHAEIEGADAVLCLRRPVLEGASASAIEGLLSARPVVVCDAGFYADIPDDLALKVPAAADQAAVSHRLEQILDRPDEMRALGQRARAWALQTFCAKRYASGLVEVVECSLKSAVMVSVARRQVALTRRWRLRHDDDLHARLEATVNGIFGF